MYRLYKIIYDFNAEITAQLNYLWLDDAEIEASIWTHKNRMILYFYHPSYTIKSGFVEVLNNKTTVLVEGAEEA